MENQKWYFVHLGGHVHVRVFQNGGKCGELCFTAREFEWVTGARNGASSVPGAIPPAIDYIPETPGITALIESSPDRTSWLIWSNEHGRWWAASEQGYTNQRSAAGRYSFADAVRIVEKANQYCDDLAPNESMVWAGGAS